MNDTIESLRARLAEVEGALREAMTRIPSQWGPSDVLAHLLRRAGERDQAVIRADAADAALAACAELRAALEHWTHIYGKALSPPGHDTYGEGMRDAKDQVRAILAHSDLGRGMVDAYLLKAKKVIADGGKGRG